MNEVSNEVVKDILLKHLSKSNALIRINIEEVGKMRINKVSESLWHAHFMRQVNGIPFRESRIVFAIKQGNLVLWGLESW